MLTSQVVATVLCDKNKILKQEVIIRMKGLLYKIIYLCYYERIFIPTENHSALTVYI